MSAGYGVQFRLEMTIIYLWKIFDLLALIEGMPTLQVFFKFSPLSIWRAGLTTSCFADPYTYFVLDHNCKRKSAF